MKQLSVILETRGWHTSFDASGNLLLSPQALSQVASAPKKVTPKHSHMDVLAARIKSTGWQVQRDMDGGILLYPKTEAETAPVESTIAQNSIQPLKPLVQPMHKLAQLSEKLRHTDWEVSHESDGGISLYPPKASPAAINQVAVEK